MHGAIRGLPAPDAGPLIEQLGSDDAEGAATRLGLLVEFLASLGTAEEALSQFWTVRTWPDVSDAQAETARIEALLADDTSDAGWKLARRTAYEKRIAALKPQPTAGEDARRSRTSIPRMSPGSPSWKPPPPRSRPMRRWPVPPMPGLAAAPKSCRPWLRPSAAVRSCGASRTSGPRKPAPFRTSWTSRWPASTTTSPPSGIAGSDSPLRKPDAVYGQVRSLSQRLRSGEVARGRHIVDAGETQRVTLAGIQEDRNRIREAAAWIGNVPDPMARAELEAAVESWADELDEETRAARQLIQSATDERDAALRALSRLRDQRRILLGWISSSEQRRDRGYLLTDVAQELSLPGSDRRHAGPRSVRHGAGAPAAADRLQPAAGPAVQLPVDRSVGRRVAVDAKPGRDGLQAASRIGCTSCARSCARSISRGCGTPLPGSSAP